MFDFCSLCGITNLGFGKSSVSVAVVLNSPHIPDVFDTLWFCRVGAEDTVQQMDADTGAGPVSESQMKLFKSTSKTQQQQHVDERT